MGKITDYPLETTLWQNINGWPAYFLKQYRDKYVFIVEADHNNLLPQLAIVDEFGRVKSYETKPYIKARWSD